MRTLGCDGIRPGEVAWREVKKPDAQSSIWVMFSLSAYR